MILEESKVGPEGGLPLVAGSNADVGKGGLEVDLGEDCAALDVVEEVVHDRKMVSVLFGDDVESPVIEAEAKITGLLDEEDGGSGGRDGATDELLLEVCVEVPTELFAFGWG